jgi:anti-anti-sigma regulatory factor
MDITIAERFVGRVTVLDIAGRLTIDHGAQYLKDTIDSLLTQGRTRIVLNLEGVPYIEQRRPGPAGGVL